MTLNIYDDPAFFAAYGKLPRSMHGLSAAPEWPNMRAMLPDIAGLRVADFGCGFGWFCRWAADNGAAEVVGYDISRNMLERARAETDAATVRYVQADLEQLSADETFDLAYSSLALHYIADLGGLLATIGGMLTPGARFVFSMEHPIFTAPRCQQWMTRDDGCTCWPLDGYQAEGPRETNWLADGVVKQHRTLGTILSLLIGAGFTVEQVEDFCPSEAQIADDPALASERERPTFLLVGARRNG